MAGPPQKDPDTAELSSEYTNGHRSPTPSQVTTTAADLSALSADHRRMLLEESAISADVAAERGIETVVRGEELPEGFSRRQRRRGAGVLFTVHRPNGETSHCFRPDEPDPEDPGRKYEQPSKHYGGPGNVLDVHPSLRHLIADVGVPVIFVEGVKKADAIISAARAAGVEVLVVAISGVWNWLSDKKPIPDLLDIPLRGRDARIVYDSDMLRNPDVLDAARRFAEYLLEREAEPRVAYLPDKPDGSKMGADDFLAAGGTLEELEMLMCPYDPAYLVVARLGRDERLRAAIAAERSGWWTYDWSRMVGTGENPNSMRGHTARDVMKALIDKAERRGRVKEGVVEVQGSTRAIAEEAATSRQSAMKALRNLEAEGLVEILEAGSAAKPRAYRLLAGRATLDHDGGEGATNPDGTRGGQDLRAPRAPCLRWSDPGRKARAGVVKGTVQVRQMKQKSRPATKRPGKIRRAELDALDSAGGSASLQEWAALLHRRPRDLRRRGLAKLLEAGLVEWFCEVGSRREVVRLVDNWREVLEELRELGGEIDSVGADGRVKKGADTLARERHARQREAYRSLRRGLVVDCHPANAGGHGWMEELAKLPEPPSKDVLYRMMRQGILVGTPRGSGRLWQVFSDQVGVVVDSEPDRVSFFDPAELLVEGAA